MQHSDFTEVYVWGSDSQGQLGLGSQKPFARYLALPKCVSFGTNISKIECGNDHSALITDRGHLFVMGSNQDGKLGIGDSTLLCTSDPTLVEGLAQPVSDVACGDDHTLAVTTAGELFAWGKRALLGLRTFDSPTQNCFFPERVNLDAKVRVESVAAGSRHSLAIDDGGSVYAWGDNSEGQLGTGLQGKDEERPRVLSQVRERAVGVACGALHSLVLGYSGRVYAMGCNANGQLGTGSQTGYMLEQVAALDGYRIKKVRARGHASAAVTSSGELFIWGRGFAAAP